MNDKRIREKLLDLRAAKGWTQAELAKKAGFGQSIIKRTEEGYQWPRTDIFLRWLEALETTPGAFFSALESHAGVEIVPGHDRLYEMLTTIVKSKNARRILGITVNLEDISALAAQEMGKPPPIEDARHRKQRRVSSR